MILRGVPPTCTPDVVLGSTEAVTPGGGAAVILMLVLGTTVGVTPLLDDGVTVTPAGKLVPPGVTLTWLFFLTSVYLLLGSMMVVVAELVAVVLTKVVPVILTIVVVAVGAPEVGCCSLFSDVIIPPTEPVEGSGVCCLVGEASAVAESPSPSSIS